MTPALTRKCERIPSISSLPGSYRPGSDLLEVDQRPKRRYRVVFSGVGRLVLTATHFAHTHWLDDRRTSRSSIMAGRVLEPILSLVIGTCSLIDTPCWLLYLLTRS